MQVYQDNVWRGDRPFQSFKRVACDMGLVDPKATAVNKGLQLVSFHSGASRVAWLPHCAHWMRWWLCGCVILDSFILLDVGAVSKGFTGECGRRGGYMELVGFDDRVRAELYKLASISLCSNIGGQVIFVLNERI